MGPLAGVKVVEFDHIMAGPVCGSMLADMGADVIKLEQLADGDDSRRTLSPDIDGESASFLMMSRTKRGNALNLKSDGCRHIARRFAGRSSICRCSRPCGQLGQPVHDSATPAEITRGAPLLGQHTREVLAEYGYCAAQVDEFLAEKAAVAENP